MGFMGFEHSYCYFILVITVLAVDSFWTIEDSDVEVFCLANSLRHVALVSKLMYIMDFVDFVGLLLYNTFGQFLDYVWTQSGVVLDQCLYMYGTRFFCGYDADFRVIFGVWTAYGYYRVCSWLY